MKAIAIKLQNISIIDHGNLALRVLHIIFISLGVLAIAYVIILGSMVFNIVERRNLESKIHTLSTEVGELELTYLSLSNNIDLNFSHSLGFKETEVKYATRKSVGSIKVNKNEI